MSPVWAAGLTAIVPNMPSLATVPLVTKLAELVTWLSTPPNAPAMIGLNWSTPANDVAPAMIGAAPDRVTVTFAVPGLGAARLQVSERTAPAVVCCWRVSTCAPKVTEDTVTFEAVEMPTARKRSLPAGTVNEKLAEPDAGGGPGGDRHDIGPSGGRDGKRNDQRAQREDSPCH